MVRPGLEPETCASRSGCVTTELNLLGYSMLTWSILFLLNYTEVTDFCCCLSNNDSNLSVYFAFCYYVDFLLIKSFCNTINK